MTTPSGAPRAPDFEFPYITCRNISGPEDEDAGRKVYAGHAPTSKMTKTFVNTLSMPLARRRLDQLWCIRRSARHLRTTRISSQS